MKERFSSVSLRASTPIAVASPLRSFAMFHRCRYLFTTILKKPLRKTPGAGRALVCILTRWQVQKDGKRCKNGAKNCSWTGYARKRSPLLKQSLKMLIASITGKKLVTYG